MQKVSKTVDLSLCPEILLVEAYSASTNLRTLLVRDMSFFLEYKNSDATVQAECKSLVKCLLTAEKANVCRLTLTDSKFSLSASTISLSGRTMSVKHSFPVKRTLPNEFEMPESDVCIVLPMKKMPSHPKSEWVSITADTDGNLEISFSSISYESVMRFDSLVVVSAIKDASVTVKSSDYSLIQSAHTLNPEKIVLSIADKKLLTLHCFMERPHQTNNLVIVVPHRMNE